MLSNTATCTVYKAFPRPYPWQAKLCGQQQAQAQWDFAALRSHCSFYVLLNAFAESPAISLLQHSSGRLKKKCTDNMVTEQIPLDVEERQAPLVSFGTA